MEHIYCTYFFDLDSIISIYLTNVYDILEYYFTLVFGNCPFFYQMVYGYAPLTYLLIRRKFRKNSYKNYFDNSSLNWLFFNIKLLSFRSFKIIILINFIEIFFKKVFFLLKFNLGNKYKYHFIFIKDLIKSLFSRFAWRPTFKKYSYFGIFALIRTKWFK